jgi:hypothetical protein
MLAKLVGSIIGELIIHLAIALVFYFGFRVFGLELTFAHSLGITVLLSAAGFIFNRNHSDIDVEVSANNKPKEASE